ncbi:hypothetical protein KI387_005823, partial [Taxus chinensis]
VQGHTEVRCTNLGAEKARKSAKSGIFVPGGPWDSWDVETRGTRKDEMAESKEKSSKSFVSRGLGQPGQKYAWDANQP